MPILKAGDLSVHYYEHGTGEPVLLIHGNWASGAWWERILARFPEGYHAIAPDLRGRGQTEGPDHSYSVSELAKDLFHFADAMGCECFHVVGHSLGSAIAMQMALMQPDRLYTLTAIAPAWVDGMPAAYGLPAQQEALHRDKALFATALKALAPTAANDEYWQRLVDEGHRQREEATFRNIPALLDWKPGEILKESGVPALVVSGSLDPLTGGANAERAAQALGAELVILEACGHSPNIEAPDQLVELLRSHFSRTTSVPIREQEHDE